MIPNYLKAAYRRNPAATRCKLNWSQGFKFPGLQKYIYIYIYLVIIPSSSMCPLTFVFRSRAAHSTFELSLLQLQNPLHCNCGNDMRQVLH